MRRRGPFLLVAALIMVSLSLTAVPAVWGEPFTVNLLEDTVSTGPADGKCDIDSDPSNGLQCTLREAIKEANDTNVCPGPDTIVFSISGTIQPTSQLPTISEQITIDGGKNIRIDGSLAGLGQNGLVAEAPGCVFKGLEITRFAIDATESNGMGIVLGNGSDDSRVEGCFLGTDASGTLGIGNTSGVGIWSSGNVIGGRTSDKRNIISGNTWNGVFMNTTSAHGNRVEGNYIGTDPTGTIKLPNEFCGVNILNASQNTIGGTDPGVENILSGNEIGVYIHTNIGIPENASQNKVQDNLIGTHKNGTDPLGNTFAGVLIEFASNNTVGGTTIEARNIISGNTYFGIEIYDESSTNNNVQGNYIGTDITGTLALPNGWDGVRIEYASNNTIGGTTGLTSGGLGLCTGACNLISGNADDGVDIRGELATGNVLYGNFIGVTANGDVVPEIKNVGTGVEITDGSTNKIGPFAAGLGIDPEEGNIIAGNGGDGVRISGDSAANNTIRGNAIYKNAGLGINLVGGDGEHDNGVTPNDVDDTDSGPNGLMNFPVGVTAFFDGTYTVISGILPIKNPENAVVDCYGSDDVDGSGSGEGRRYLSSAFPHPNGAFKCEITGELPYDGELSFDFVSATATNDLGATSEFSPVCGDPDNLDTTDRDFDGLCDDWELNGIDFNADGNIDLHLNELPYEADVNVPDIFVEIDYMKNEAIDAEPLVAALNNVKQAFANKNINLHLVGNDSNGLVDEAIPVVPYLWFKLNFPGDDLNDFWDLKWGDPSKPCDGYFGTSFDRGGHGDPTDCVNILGARRLAFHYAIFGYSVADAKDANGIAETCGNDILVAVDQLDEDAFVLTAMEKNPTKARIIVEARTFMHELGHNLCLRHGGGDGIENKPNYLSIMNYLFTYRQIVKDSVLDYSSEKLATLDESNLNENNGIAVGIPLAKLSFKKTSFTFYDEQRDKCFFSMPVTSNLPINWNQKKKADEVGVRAGIHLLDISDSDEPKKCEESAGLFTILEGHHDWNSLRYNFRGTPGFEDHIPRSYAVPEPSGRELMEMAKAADSDGDGFSNYDDNCPNIANPDQANNDGDRWGNVCDNCPNLANGEQEDNDDDGRGNVCDNCPDIANPDQADWDEDDQGDVCDPDDDNDKMPDPYENDNEFDPFDPADAGYDSDDDGFSNLREYLAGTDPRDSLSLPCAICRADLDADGLVGNVDLEILSSDFGYTELVDSEADIDKDEDVDGKDLDKVASDFGRTDCDQESDGVPDSTDNCPCISNINQTDTDGDGIGDACE